MIDYTEQMNEYAKMSCLREKINLDLLKYIPKELFVKYAKNFGATKKKSLVFKSEIEGIVIMDSAIYNCKLREKRYIQYYFDKNPYPTDSEEYLFLSALLQSRYTMIVVKKVIEGAGIEVKDIEGNSFLLTDRSFSKTATADMALATRIVSVGGINMTTGAGLPIQGVIIDNVVRRLGNLIGNISPGEISNLSPAMKTKMEILIIKCCLEGGATNYIRYSY